MKKREAEERGKQKRNKGKVGEKCNYNIHTLALDVCLLILIKVLLNLHITANPTYPKATQDSN